MTLYKLDEWEHNGYDDSDWYAVVYNNQTDKLERVLTGTTRYADALHCGPPMEAPTAEVLELAKAANRRLLGPTLVEAEKRRVLTPYPLSNGEKVRVKTEIRLMMKESEDCRKCSGTGFWVNPNRAEDQRSCFACHGTGEHTGARVKVAGKQQWIKIPIGKVGEVMDSKVWGQFYRSGYNQPNPSNTRVLVRFEDGQHWVPADKLQLDQDPRDEAELIRLWKEAGRETDFYRYFRTSHVSLK